MLALKSFFKDSKMSLCPENVLITGANRGIGLEFVKQFAALPKPPAHVFAGCRTPDQAKVLKVSFTQMVFSMSFRMGFDARKPVFGVSDQVKFKPACSATGWDTELCMEQV